MTMMIIENDDDHDDNVLQTPKIQRRIRTTMGEQYRNVQTHEVPFQVSSHPCEKPTLFKSSHLSEKTVNGNAYDAWTLLEGADPFCQTRANLMGNLHGNICVLILLPLAHTVHKQCLTDTYSPRHTKKTKQSLNCIWLICLLIQIRAILKCDPETSVITASAHTFTKEHTPYRVGHGLFSVNSVPASQRTLRVHHQTTNRAMHYAVCSENPTKYTDTQCEQYTEFLNAAKGGTCSYYWASKG